MRLTLIALLLAGPAGCGSDPATDGGSDEEPTSSFEETRNAAEQGDVPAQFTLGLMYARGEGGPKDYAEAVKWYRKAAERGHASAQFYLGHAFHMGWGVSEDDVEAVKWFRKSAEQGHAGGQFHLGVKYDLGEGVPEDDLEAYVWFAIADANGHLFAEDRMPELVDTLTPDQLAAAGKRIADLTGQINASTAE